MSYIRGAEKFFPRSLPKISISITKYRKTDFGEVDGFIKFSATPCKSKL